MALVFVSSDSFGRGNLKNGRKNLKVETKRQKLFQKAQFHALESQKTISHYLLFILMALFIVIQILHVSLGLLFTNYCRFVVCIYI